MKILHIAATQAAVRKIRKNINKVGHIIEHCVSVNDKTLTRMSKQLHDLVLLDSDFVMKTPGYDVLHEMMCRSITTPVIVLSPVHNSDEKVRVLQSGATDYITQPFHRDELIALMEAVLRRSEKNIEDNIVSSNLQLFQHKRKVYVDGKSVASISPKMFLLLQAFLEAKGQLVSRRSIEESLYGEMLYRTSFHVFRTRVAKILEKAGWNQTIKRVAAGMYAVR